jgi:anti-sigma B factor antagonist
MLQIRTKDIAPDIVVLEVAGRLSFGRDCKQLERAVDNVIREGRKKVVFDLTGVTNIDSTGVGTIVISASRVRKAEGQLRVVSSAQVEHVLKTTNVNQIVAVHSTTEAAVAGF